MKCEQTMQPFCDGLLLGFVSLGISKAPIVGKEDLGVPTLSVDTLGSLLPPPTNGLAAVGMKLKLSNTVSLAIGEAGWPVSNGLALQLSPGCKAVGQSRTLK